MYFLYPEILWGLLLLLVPVIIHFFNIRKYKKKYFSDINLLKQITQEHQIKSKLKDYIVLTTRLLALFFLIIAFSQPVFDNNNKISKNKNSEVILYIDNSFSMENISKEGKLFDVALSKASEIIQSFPKSTKYFVITNDLDTKTHHSLSQEESLEYLSKLKISSASLPLSVIYKRIESIVAKNPIFFILSDGQKVFTDFKNIDNKKTNTFYLLFSPSQSNNISIDSVWIDNPVILLGNTYNLHLKITNHSSENISNIPVKLLMNDIQTAVINISIPAYQSVENTISFIPKNQHFQFSKIILNDYPITFDDELYFSFNTDVRIKVLLINGYQNPASSKYIKSLFQNDSIFIISEQQEKQINFSEIATQDVVILNEISEFSSGLEEQIKILCNKGKTVIIIPHIQNTNINLPHELQFYTWKTDTNRQTLSNDLFSHPLLLSSFEKNNVSNKMPLVKEYIVSNNYSYFEPILQLNNNKPLLLRYSKNKWNYFIFTSTLNPDKNQLPIHSIFVPLMYQLSFTSVPNIPLYYYNKNYQNIKIPNINFTLDNSPKIVSADKNNNHFQIIPIFKNEEYFSYISIPTHYDLLPGHYYLQFKDKNVFALSFNYNRTESNMQFYSLSEMKDILSQYNLKNISVNEPYHQSIQKIIQSEITGQSYWKLCLILCLIFLVIESVVIRWIR